MSRVFLLRHSKASWPEPGMRDFDRPLAPRGTADATKIGSVMRAGGYRPDMVICSAAKRTRETWDHIAPRLDVPDDRVIFTTDLYEGGDEQYLEVTRTAGDVESVLIIGHNPMMEDFASALAAGGSDAALRRLSKGFPTSGLAVIKLDGTIGEIALATGYLEAFLRPSNLSGAEAGG